VIVDAAGNLYIADTWGTTIRMVASGMIWPLAGRADPDCLGDGFNSGDGGPALNAGLSLPMGIALDASGNIYVADSGNNRVRVMTPTAATCSYALSAAAQTVAPAGGSGSISVAAPDGCSWVALNSLSWVTLTGITSGTGNGTVAFTIAPNPGGIGGPRSGVLFVGGIPFTVQQPGDATAPPTIPLGGVVPVDGAANTIQPGEWVSIYGTNLASSAASWARDFPTSLGGTSVTINGRPAYLSYVSPNQINLQAPDDTATGPVPVVVTAQTGTATATVTLAQFAPAFLLLDNTHVVGIILRSDGSGAYGGGTYDIIGLPDPQGAPARVSAGDVIELFAIGFGPTNPAVPAGHAFSGAAPVTNPVEVLIGKVAVTPSFAGLSSAGLYQINLTVPATPTCCEVSIVATVGGVQTPAGTLIPLQW